MPGDVALYGEHAAIIRYVADVWGVEDRERADRRWIHVEPYWRGPEDAPIALRSHKLTRED